MHERGDDYLNAHVAVISSQIVNNKYRIFMHHMNKLNNRPDILMLMEHNRIKLQNQD